MDTVKAVAQMGETIDKFKETQTALLEEIKATTEGSSAEVKAAVARAEEGAKEIKGISAQIVEKLSEESFFGCNVENASFGATICAERSAICSMVSKLGTQAKIKEVHIVSDMTEPVSPCGVCRQSLAEFSTEETSIYVYAKNMKSYKRFSMIDLLPHAFVSF